jgi:hypothetical protein
MFANLVQNTTQVGKHGAPSGCSAKPTLQAPRKQSAGFLLKKTRVAMRSNGLAEIGYTIF